MTTNYFVVKAKRVRLNKTLYMWFIQFHNNDEWIELTRFNYEFGWKLTCITSGWFNYWATLEKEVNS